MRRFAKTLGVLVNAAASCEERAGSVSLSLPYRILRRARYMGSAFVLGSFVAAGTFRVDRLPHPRRIPPGLRRRLGARRQGVQCRRRPAQARRGGRWADPGGYGPSCGAGGSRASADGPARRHDTAPSRLHRHRRRFRRGRWRELPRSPSRRQPAPVAGDRALGGGEPHLLRDGDRAVRDRRRRHRRSLRDGARGRRPDPAQSVAVPDDAAGDLVGDSGIHHDPRGEPDRGGGSPRIPVPLGGPAATTCAPWPGSSRRRCMHAAWRRW